MPIHRNAIVVDPSAPVVSSIPARAIKFRIGRTRKVYGHKAMQKLYIFAQSNVRSR